MMNMVSEGRAVASRLGSMCGGAADAPGHHDEECFASGLANGTEPDAIAIMGRRGAAAEAFRKFSVHFDGYGRFGEGELAPPERVIENPPPQTLKQETVRSSFCGSAYAPAVGEVRARPHTRVMPVSSGAAAMLVSVGSGSAIGLWNPKSNGL